MQVSGQLHNPAALPPETEPVVDPRAGVWTQWQRQIPSLAPARK